MELIAMPGDYDIAVIGGGAAGLAAARTARARQARTLLISDGPVGGECTFTGCVPSKTLIEAARHGADFATAMTEVRTAVQTIAATESADVLRGEGIDVLTARARFSSPGVLVADPGGRIVARRFVIASGSRPAIPLIPGLAGSGYLTNETFFSLGGRPGRLAVLGGGAIGCELAQAAARLGAAVTLVEAADRLLPPADPEASEAARAALTRDGVRVLTGTTVSQVSRSGPAIVLRLSSGEHATADQLLVATGRRPSTGGCGLEDAGVRLGERGQVITSRTLRSTTAGIYAAGDVTGLMPFTHAAYAMGRIAARNALRSHLTPPASFRTAAIPWVVFTDPEVAQAGLTEQQAARQRTGAKVAYLPMAELDRAVAARRTDGFIKIITAGRPGLGLAGGGRVVGATVVAERAGEMISELGLAIRTGMFTGRLAQAAHPYPAWSLAIQQATAQFFGEFGGRTARPARE